VVRTWGKEMQGCILGMHENHMAGLQWKEKRERLGETRELGEKSEEIVAYWKLRYNNPTPWFDQWSRLRCRRLRGGRY